VLHRTIESVMERGEKIENLVAKSDGLSAQSKMFYTQVRHLSKLGYLGSGSYANQYFPGEKAELLLHGHVNMYLQLRSFCLAFFLWLHSSDARRYFAYSVNGLLVPTIQSALLTYSYQIAKSFRFLLVSTFDSTG
jgi:hypothetical protein